MNYVNARLNLSLYVQRSCLIFYTEVSQKFTFTIRSYIEFQFYAIQSSYPEKYSNLASTTLHTIQHYHQRIYNLDISQP